MTTCIGTSSTTWVCTSGGSAIELQANKGLEDVAGLGVLVDDSSIEIHSDGNLRVKASGITNAMLGGSIADSKLSTITTDNKVSIAALDIDGGSDINAAVKQWSNLGDTEEAFILYSAEGQAAIEKITSLIENNSEKGLGKASSELNALLIAEAIYKENYIDD